MEGPKEISIVVAISKNNVIGRDGKLPWHLSDDLRNFRTLTMGNTVVVGRKTWESIGKPLAGRHMVVVSRQKGFNVQDATVASSVDQALDLAVSEGQGGIFVMGGAEVYQQALSKANRLYVTRVNAEVQGDTFFPEFDESIWGLKQSKDHDADERNEFPFTFMMYERKVPSDMHWHVFEK